MQEVGNADRQFVMEAVQMHRELSEAMRKVEAAQKVAKNSGLFESNNYQIQTIADAVDDEIKVVRRKLEELQTGNCVQAAIRDILQSRLFEVTKQFKVMLQARTQYLRLLEEKKSGLSTARTLTTSSRFSPTFLSEAR